MLYFEDFLIGQARSAGAHELTTEDMVAFARQWDPQPWHVDPFGVGRPEAAGHDDGAEAPQVQRVARDLALLKKFRRACPAAAKPAQPVDA